LIEQFYIVQIHKKLLMGVNLIGQ